MEGYKRIKSSKTIDSLEFLSSPKAKHINVTEDLNPSQETKPHEHLSELENVRAPAEKRSSFGALKFCRNSSTSSAASSMQRSAVKRAFSMRRSSSVSQRYCRIHDQHAGLSSPQDDEEFAQGMDSSAFGCPNKMKKSVSGGRRILQSCKRIFGI